MERKPSGPVRDIYTPKVMEMLNQLTHYCDWVEVSYSIHRNESCHMFYLSIDSAAPTECWIGKDRSSLESCIEDAINWIAPIYDRRYNDRSTIEGKASS